MKSFLGSDGLLRLLYILERSDHQTEHVIEMIKRLQIPGYEQVRDSLRAAAGAGVYEKADHLTMANIEAVLHWKAQQGTEV